ncbi:shikimate dehydrogenase [Paenibacillus gansuensis]|uniref:Shikimate dehydrogenase (NADP(+)) n=1 Tax=Paenibacillus gansuensis TaxID=306542 RepID=A0ABW5PCR6_9BACL
MGLGDQGRLDSYTQMFGVFGDPVRHSRSPVMMNRAFQATGVNGAYAAFHVKPAELKQAVEGIRALGFRGVNVTIPHKVEVMNYLDEIDEGARFIGAVNTIVNENGMLTGYNTDGIGYVRSLKEETGITLKGSRIVIIGAGGAAKGVAYALAKESPERIVIVNRTEEKARELADNLSALVDAEGMGLAALENSKESCTLVVNTTSVGMFPDIGELPAPTSWLKPGMTVSDLIYNPLETRWLKEAAEAGCVTHGGLGMFIYQGAFAFEYWTGIEAPAAVMRETVLASLLQASTAKS